MLREVVTTVLSKSPLALPGMRLSSLLDTQAGASFGFEGNKCSFAAGASWIEFAGKDLSVHAGKTRLVYLYDSAGKLAWGWLGGAGAGEALGDEILSNGAFTSSATDWNKTNCNLSSVAGGQSGNCLQIDTTGSSAAANQIVSATAKRLYKATGYYKKGTASCQVIIRDQTAVAQISTTGILSATSFTAFTAYGVAPVGCEQIKMLYFANGGSGKQAWYDEVSLKVVTAPGATGLYVFTTSLLSAQGWNMDVGFNLNDNAYTFEIYQAIN